MTETPNLREELRKVEAALATQESWRGVLPDDQLDAALAALRAKREALLRSGGVDMEAERVTIQGDVTGRDKIVNILTLDEAFFRRVIGQASPPEDMRKATQRYLQYLVDRYRYLDFKGMGVSDRVPLRLELQDLYVPLKARVELPRGETWARDLLLAGRKMPEEEREHIGERLSEPMPLSGLLEQYSGLIILGDPGAGKTTFLKHLALQMATGGADEPLLPVLVPLSAYANALDKKDVRLDDFIAGHFHDLGANLPIKAMVCQALEAGGAVVMLDGLDEIKDLGLRDTVVQRVVDFYTFHREVGNKFLLTSRIVGYREVRPTAEGLAECTLVDFSSEEIEDFVSRWTGAIERAAHGDTPVAAQEAARERGELLDAVRRNPGVRGLAANPLLLTILALMKRQGVTLPERRVELYDQYVKTLLSSWNRARGLGRPPTRDLDVVETLRVLAPLALWMHEVNPGVGVVRQGDLKRYLEGIYEGRGEAEPEKAARQFLADVREYAGLLLERGHRQYGFIHLTFEEYLAAVALAQQGQQSVEPIVSALAAHIGDPAWHEVSLLTVGYLGIVQQRDQAAGGVVEGLAAVREGAILAGEAVIDAWPGGVTPGSKAKVVTSLLAVMTGGDEPRLRAYAGVLLAKLGDPRFRADAWYLPDEPLLGFVEIPAGPFVMGDEQRRMNLPAYYIGRYPVTNAQFGAFVADGGYTEKWRGGWTEAGWEWKERNSLTEPRNPGEPFNLANHPVVDVSWYEAIAYCRWLTEKLWEWKGTPEPLASLLRDEGWRICLPNEPEWEKAARGTDGRVYPWGDKADPNLANYDKTGIDTTSAVGCFPSGASPYGVQGMSGNVWEWTRSHRRAYPYRADDGREDLKAGDDNPRVCRGGAYANTAGNVLWSYRGDWYPYDRYRRTGFRVVVVLPFS